MSLPKLKAKDIVEDPNKEYNQFTNVDQRETNDEISIMAITELLNEKKLKRTSRVKFEQVSILAKLYMFTNVFKENFTKDLGDLILELQISTNGLGRKELVQLVQQRTDMFELATQKTKTSRDIFR